MSHRLFIGLRPPANIRGSLLGLMQGIDNARWQDEDQLHLTLRYVGDVETHMADDLAHALHTATFAPFELRISGTGIFERKSIARALWAGCERSEPLERLQRKVERICQDVGITPEGRKFLPHITLARLNMSSGPVANFLAENAMLALEPWTVREFVLYESELRPEGSIYTPIVRYPANS